MSQRLTRTTGQGERENIQCERKQRGDREEGERDTQASRTEGGAQAKDKHSTTHTLLAHTT